MILWRQPSTNDSTNDIVIYDSMYSRIDEVEFVEDSL